MGKRILCMGAINMDLVMYMKRLPTGGETVVTDNFQTFPGGKGGNQAAAAAKLGGGVKFFTKLSYDDFSKELIRQQEQAGTDMTGLLYETDATAGIAMIRVDENGQNSISFTPGANRLLTPADVREHSHVFDDCGILLITMEIATDTVYEAIRIAHDRGMIIIVDPAPAPVEGIPAEIAAMIDYLKPNETEAEILTGIPVTDCRSAAAALRILREQGIKTPVITLGEKGAVTYIDGEICVIPAREVETVDTTAAGDVFLGAFAAALAREHTYQDCLAFAAAAAALSTTRKGAQTSIPEISEINVG